MGPAEFFDKLAKAKELGHERMILTKTFSRSPKNWERVKIENGKPALFARCVGQSTENRYVVDVLTADVERWVKGHGL